MPKLFKTICHIDEHYRPYHTIIEIGEGDRPLEKLLAQMDADVTRWQSFDIMLEQEDRNELARKEGTLPPVIDGWDIPGVRWEMQRSRPTDPRVFAARRPEGGSWSVSYHFLP